MCGIAGFVGASRAGIERVTATLAKYLAHRGPDGEGVEVFPARTPGRVVALVQRRLAIIDLSPGGRQPMRDPETGNWVLQNGEIYNYHELRADLVAHGALFRSASDTEVILKGYAVWGAGILDRLEGMFALAIWDERRDGLLLAVDPAGIKPLYYWRDSDGSILFASEVRALLATGMVAPHLDPVGLEGYLAYGAVQEPHTIVRGVETLSGGSWLRVSGDGASEGPRRYWLPSFAPAEASAVEAGALQAELPRLLWDAVRRHLVSDVPVGVFLSGGIDSSSLVALMSEVAPESVRTLSVTFAEHEYSEAPYSKAIAKLYSREHQEIRLGDRDLFAMLPDALGALDQPTIDGTNVYVISRAARKAGLKVVLSGQGGDELFAGYPTFRLVPQALAWRSRLGFVPRAGWRLAGRVWGALRRSRALPDKLAQFLSDDGSPLATYLVLRQLFPPDTRRRLFPDGPVEGTVLGLPRPFAEDLEREVAGLDPVNQVSLLELRTYLAQMLLRDSDVMSMAHGLELRVPFLDRRLVEFVARVPGRQKVSRSLPKPILIRAMGTKLPEAIYLRPKQGFTFPWEVWLRGALRESVEAGFASKALCGGTGLDWRTCQEFWQGFVERRPGLTWSRVWALHVLLDWCRRHGARLS